MIENIKDLKAFENEVRGKDIYVIGGGTSFKPKEHPELLPKDRVICINSALYDFDHCLASVWMDNSWYSKNKDLVSENRQKYAIRFTTSDREVHAKNKPFISIKNTGGKCEYSKPFEPYVVRGNNTGCCTIELLDSFKAKTIYLIGFDCNVKDGISHYHRRYKKMVKQSVYDTTFIPCFESLAKQMRHSRVVNLSQESNIKCFKRAKLESVLAKPESDECDNPAF